MRRRLGGVRLSKVNTAMPLFGLALVVAVAFGSRVTVNGTQIGSNVPWWLRGPVVGIGVLLVFLAVLASREPATALRADRGFLGAPPREPDRLVARPDLVKAVVSAILERPTAVAVVGIGGVGKSALAAVVCGDRRVRRRFGDGVTWLEAGAGKDPVTLLADLARRLGISGAESGFGTVGQGRDVLAAALRGKHVLIAVDNVWDSGPLHALLSLAPACTLLFTTRQPELATIVNAAQVRVDELTPEQSLQLLGLWTGQTAVQLPNEASSLCARLGNLALAIAMAGAMVARGRTFGNVLALIDQDLGLVRAELDPAYSYKTLRVIHSRSCRIPGQ